MTEEDGSLDDAVRDALAELLDDAEPANAVDRRSLGMGIRLALERPDDARALLHRIERRDDDRPVAPVEPADVPDEPAQAPQIPVASSLLARAAALPPSEWATVGPDVVFGWVARLTAAEVLHLGRVVGELLAGGSSPDVGRGFGLAWTDGVRVPRPELDVMLREFTELEITVGGILAGAELRTGTPTPPRGGLASWFGDWVPRSRPGESKAADAIELHGEPAKRGLVALWNVWMAMRYRELIPPPTFERMVHPWVTVIGPLPGPT